MRSGLITAAILLAALSACSPNSDTPDNSETSAKSEAQMSGPFEQYTPWDSSREGVHKTESGLEYIIIKSGDASGISPVPTDQVTVHYDGRLAEGGKKFDSSYDRGAPATFPAGGLIPGWVEALQLMKPGDEWLLFIPSDLGYGARGAGADIPANADLIFHMELLDVIRPQAADEEAWAKYTPWPGEATDVMKTESGLEYIILDSGDESLALPEAEDFVLIHAECRVAESGEIVVSSFREGSPKRLPASEPVLGEGWKEAIMMMRPGDHWLVKVPYQLAFGEEGSGPIPEKADVIFEIDMQQVIDL